MKKILSLILAISLVLALLPTFASAAYAPAGSQELTFGEGGITEFIYGTGRATLKIENGVFAATKIQTRAILKNHKSSHTAYAAFEFVANNTGAYELKLKTDNPTKYSSYVSFYFLEESQYVKPTDYPLSDGKAAPAYFLGSSHAVTYRVGQFDFANATAGKYENVLSSGNKVIVNLEKGKTYALIAYCDDITAGKIVADDPATADVNEANTYKSGSYECQEFFLSGIRFEPVMEMYFNSSVITSMQKYDEEEGKNVAAEPAAWTITPAANWIVDSTISRPTNYGTQSAKENLVVISLSRSSKAYEPWSTYTTGNTNNNNKAKQSIFTIKSTLPTEEGYYRIKVLGGKYNKGTNAAFYVDNKFAGWYDCYDENATNPVVDSEIKTLNTVYLTPDSDGTVSIVISSEGPTFNSDNGITTDDINLSTLVLSKIELEYLGKEKPLSATPDKIVIEEYPEALEEAGTAPISAYVLMKDGSKLQISGMERAIDHATTPLCPRTDKDNFIKVSASENLSIAADFEGKYVQNGVFTNPDGNATGTVTANASGDATITVSAKVDGVELTPVTVNVTVPSNEPPAPAEPGEELDETVTFGFGAEMSFLNDYISAPGYTAGSPAQVPVGTKITLSAEKEKDEYRFLYWKISGRFYSADNEITLNVARNTSVLAVYADVEYLETEKYKKIYFWNADKSYYSQISTPEEKLPYIPGGLEMTGMSFVGWYLDEETELTTDTLITELVTNVVAKYEPLDTEYTVKINGEENKGKYNSSVSVSAPEAFTYWKLGEEKLSFRRAFEFFNYGNAEITSIFDESVKAVPTVVIEKSLGAAFITYDTPAGYERIEAGIIFGPTAEITVNSANSKANAQKTAAFGQFTAKPYDNEQYARGYQIFKKDGIVRVIYTNAIEMN